MSFLRTHVVGFSMMICCSQLASFPARSAEDGSSGARFVTFDAKGEQATYPVVINPAGVVAGNTFDANNVEHGFLRCPDGRIVVFDPPGSTSTTVTGITPSGLIVGYYNGPGSYIQRGFLRSLDGSFKTFGSPAPYDFILPQGINPWGIAAGGVADSSTNQSFVRLANGRVIVFAPSDATSSTAYAINSVGETTGYYVDTKYVYHGFVGYSDRTFKTFDPPVASYQFITPAAINPAGYVVGSYFDSVFHGFLRTPYGRVTAIDVPGAEFTESLSINPAGISTGFFFDGSTNHFHGFLRTLDGEIEKFVAPKAADTNPQSINQGGTITGSYIDATGATHGFLRLP